MSEQQRAVDAICREILRVDELGHAAQDLKGDTAFHAALSWGGEVIGLRKALCVLFGWPMDEAEREGKADQYAQKWADEWLGIEPDGGAAPERPTSSEEKTV